MEGEASLARVAPGPLGWPLPSLLLAGKGLRDAGAAMAESSSRLSILTLVFRSLKPQATRSTCPLGGSGGRGPERLGPLPL